MDFVADLHLHSKYSRAVSQDMVLPQMAKWARIKGVDVLSATDFTHPLWLRELKSLLKEEYEGLYSLKSEAGKTGPDRTTLFLLSTEISSIYKQEDKLRRIHNLVFAPNIETVEKINKEFLRRGFNLSSDGRPIIGLSSVGLLELLLSIDTRILLIPCHVWTPHFGMYGSASGFDSIEESFGEYGKYIYGVETGLSSDPEMNWQMAELKTRSILSFSDAHSNPKMGREATVFALRKNEISNLKSQITNLSYDDFTQAIKRTPDSKLKIAYTIEFYPEEGKYHFSGHRNCKIVKGPDETRKDGNMCPVCKKRLTEGVLYRVQQLSSEKLIGNVDVKLSPSGIKWYTDKTRTHPPFVKLVPLLEIIAEALKSTTSSQKVRNAYTDLCKEFKSEIEILLKVPIETIEKTGGQKIAEGVDKVRRGDIVIDPGYDGEYGKVKIWNDHSVTEATNEAIAQIGIDF
ncbi:MAG: DNA helicase UvrD [Candidatus Levybacteria bacterium]|nr:DNA helicase UvrD [Candidatus Levybacteria bacterium]